MKVAEHADVRERNRNPSDNLYVVHASVTLTVSRNISLYIFIITACAYVLYCFTDYGPLIMAEKILKFREIKPHVIQF